MPHRSRSRASLAALAPLSAVILTAACVSGPGSADSSATSPPTEQSSAPRPPGTSVDPPAPPGSGSRDPLGPRDPGEHAELSAWRLCGAPFECATLTVPRDWTDVDGPTLALAVIRHPASGAAGGGDRDDDPPSAPPLLLNPGGPGGSGVSFLRGFVGGGLPAGLAERFDLVSWDPRGTGASERIDCTDDAELLELEVDPTPDDADELAAYRAEADATAAACVEQVGPLLTQVGTRATVRDMEALRSALGGDELTYVGYSYGTTIGLEYLRLYPDRVRAMVLDGVTAPGVDPFEDTLTQARGFERTLDAYLAGCATRPRCPLGPDPKATLLDLTARVDASPVPADYRIEAPGAADREGSLGPGELAIGIASALYTTASWSTLDTGFAELLAPEPSGRTLLALRDEYLGRAPDGSWADDHDARAAIRCADQAERPSRPEGDLDRTEGWADELPFWGAWFASGAPGCWGLPAAIEPLEPLERAALADAPPVVVVGSTQDPATPYSQARDVAELLPEAILVTFDGAEHTVYRRLTECVDAPLTRYLIDLVAPTDGLRCDP